MEKPKTRNIYQFKQLDEQYSKKVEKLVEIDKKTKSYIKKLTYHIKKILMKDEELKHYKELEKKIDKLPEITQKEIKQLIKDEYSLSME
jgi:molecular chaperone DnaK (HSP70)